MVRAFRSCASLLIGGGLVFFVGMPSAGAQASSACSQIESTLSSIQKELPQANSATLASKVASFATQLETEAASASPSVKSAVGAFVTDLEAAATGKVNIPKLTADANAIGTTCTTSVQAAAPTAAPATGAGTTAGVQDAGLIYGGAGAVAAGGGLLVLGLRRRRARVSS